MLSDEPSINEFKKNNLYEIIISARTSETSAISSSEDEFLIYSNEEIQIYMIDFSKDEVASETETKDENSRNNSSYESSGEEPVAIPQMANTTGRHYSNYS